MAWLATYWDILFPDAIFYCLTAVVFLFGIWKCCRPVLQNARALQRGYDLLNESAKAKLARPVWNDIGFLGKRLQPVWRLYLQSVDMGRASGIASDVAEYVQDDSIITVPGKSSLAEMIPGVCTSIGILGTFVGLSLGLNGLDVMEISSYTQLTSGIALAFNTSIVGIIASLLFNILYHYAVGKARRAIDRFVGTFYLHGIAPPADATTQLLAYEREQTGAFMQFTEDLSTQLSGTIQHAIAVAMEPVQHSMEDFIGVATRAQVDGLDYVVARFIDRMNKSLDGQLHRLGQALSDAADGQLRAQEQLQGAVSSISDLSDNMVKIHGISDQLITKFAGYVGDMGSAYREISESQADANDLLAEVTEASARQAKYLSAIQEYQAQLQGSFRDYTVWTDTLIGGMETRTQAQNAELERIGGEMRTSGDLLRGSYKSFTESIQLGLTNTLGLFNENTQQLLRDLNQTLATLQSLISQLDATLANLPIIPPDKQEVE